MLSIGKVGGGQGDPRYYIDTVAQGKDDYYTHRGEAQGQWEGRGANNSGLTGAVEDEEFLNLLTRPSTIANKPKTVLAYDLTFSAPKSVSVVYGISDRTVSPVVRQAHDDAVRDALGYLERHATWTRRGKNGKHLLRGEGLTVAAFRHRTSRAGDPQLHTHAVVANTTRADGRDTAVDGRALYAHQRTAGFLYQAALRKNLTDAFGVGWEPVRNGMAEISGIDDEILKHFSRRSQEIRERLAEVGGRSAHAAEVAALETRKAKDYNVPTERLRDEWRARAAEFGLDRHVLELVLGRRTPDQPNLAETAKHLAAPEGITEQASTFDRRDALRDWAEAHRDGATVERLEQLADRWLASRHAVQLERDSQRPPLGGPRYSTPEMLELEDRVITDATRRQHTNIAALDESKVNDLLASHASLAGEQAAMTRALTTSGDGVQVVRAAAGTGKTRGLMAARDAWEAHGVRVFGTALAARAAVEMETLAGVDSTTIARLVVDIDQGNGLPPGSVLVVDEAGMVGSRTIDRLARHAAETQSKLVLVGDDRQLPEIDAGGAFRRLAKELGAIELHQVHRQQNVWDREALAQLRQGKVQEWNDAYRDHGRLVARLTSEELRDALVDDWWESARSDRGKESVMIAHRRADVAKLNARARARMHRDGRLGDQELQVEPRAFAVGDRVIARRNDRRADLVNGTRGEVVDVDLEHRELDVRLGDGSTRRIASSYLDDGWLDHAYALTAHAAQGATVDRSFVLGSDELYREWGYTALSRHRDQARFYVVSPGSVERALPGLEPDRDAISDDVVAMLSPSRRKELALDVLDRAGDRERQRAMRSARDAIAGAERRIAAMREERDAIGWLQRSRRTSIDRDIGRQQDAIERWAKDARTPDAEKPARARHVERDAPVAPDKSPDREQTRAALLDPSKDLLRELGDRPSAFTAREAWLRDACRLLGRETLARSRPMPSMHDDFGMDR